MIAVADSIIKGNENPKLFRGIKRLFVKKL